MQTIADIEFLKMVVLCMGIRKACGAQIFWGGSERAITFGQPKHEAYTLNPTISVSV